MFRKVIFSKEPTVLNMESMDDIVRIQMKNKHSDGIYSLQGNSNTFSIIKGDGVQTLLEIYPSDKYGPISTQCLHVPAVETKYIQSDALILQSYTIKHQQSQENSTEYVTKGMHSEVYGMRYQLPSRFHMHRFLTRVGVNEHTEWARIQQSRFGIAQLGIGTTSIDPTVGLHVNGAIRCDKIITSKNPVYEDNLSALQSSNLLWFDKDGKIPAQYLPEVYRVSILQNDAGVGIGTRAPVQKLHVEGGCYIRDRIGVGITEPTGIMHISNISSTLPVLKIEQPLGNCLEIWKYASDTQPILSVNPNYMKIGNDAINNYELQIRGTVKTGILDTEQLIVRKNDTILMQTTEIPLVDNKDDAELTNFGTSTALEIHTPVYIRGPLTCASIQNTPNISIQTEKIDAPNASLLIKEALISSISDTSHKTVFSQDSLSKQGILDEMMQLHSCIYTQIPEDTQPSNYHAGFLKDDLVKGLQNQNEVVKLLTSSSSPDTVNQSMMIHLLWEAVKHLSQRVKDLEGQKS